MYAILENQQSIAATSLYFCCTKLFLFPLCNCLCNYLADSSVLSFHYKNIYTLLFKA